MTGKRLLSKVVHFVCIQGQSLFERFIKALRLPHRRLYFCEKDMGTGFLITQSMRTFGFWQGFGVLAQMEMYTCKTTVGNRRIWIQFQRLVKISKGKVERLHFILAATPMGIGNSI
jgi:hypothetical protein